MEKRSVPVDSELNAVMEYDHAFRFILSDDKLSEYSKGFVNWHKQRSIEISIVCEGAVNLYVLERMQTVKAGDGFCILPGYLHSIQPAAGCDNAHYFTLIFYPEILYGQQGSFFDAAYYHPLMQKKVPFFTFSAEALWTSEVTQKLRWVFEHYPDTSPEFRLKTQRILQDVWIAFAANVSPDDRFASKQKNTRKILDLLEYLHTHYQDKIVLQEMADHASMSKGECSRYFKKMMHMTITEYLLEYRLSKAAELLETAALNITEIADQTGFCDVSYFIKKFHQKLGITPKAYAGLRGK